MECCVGFLQVEKRNLTAMLKEKITKFQDVILYIFFGVCTTLVNIITYWLCAHIFLFKVLPSAIVAWFFAVLFAYLTNRKWVFHSEAVRRNEILREVFSFYICRLTTGFIDWALMYVLVDVMNFNDIIIKSIANFLVIILNFIASKLIIFRKR